MRALGAALSVLSLAGCAPFDAAGTSAPGTDAGGVRAPAAPDGGAPPLAGASARVGVEEGAAAVGLAVDGEALYVSIESGRILRKPKSETTGGLGSLVHDAKGEAGYLALDGTSIFWSDRAGRRVRRVGKDGTGVADVATGIEAPMGLVVHAGVVWVASYTTDKLYSGAAYAPGPAVERRAFNAGSVPEGLTIEDASILVAQNGGGEISAVDLAATSHAARVAIGKPAAIAVDSTHLYVTTQGSGPSGSVVRVSRSNPGDQETLWTSPSHFPTGIAVDETHVYWLTYGGGELWRLRK